MAFCSNCGTQLADGVKFCTNCGTVVGTAGNENIRKQEFVGAIKKCSNCGQILQAFQAKCPSCGNEIIGVSNATSVREFFDKYTKAPTNESKFELINSYPIPNTREDLLEFSLLACQQIKALLGSKNAKETKSMFGSMFFPTGKMFISAVRRKKVDSDDLLVAWQMKLEQIEAKIKLSFINDNSILSEFKQMVSEAYQAKTKFKRNKIIRIGVICTFFAIIVIADLVILLPSINNSKKHPEINTESKERVRLETLMKEIQTDMGTGNYDTAEIKLQELRWNYNQSSKSEKANVDEWENKREILKKRLDKASGVSNK